MKNEPILTAIFVLLGLAFLIWLLDRFINSRKVVVDTPAEPIVERVVEQPVVFNRPVFTQPSTMPISNGNVNAGARISMSGNNR